MAYEVTSKSTKHSAATPHGYSTLHRYPQSDPSLQDIVINLTKSLYPTGRAWQMSQLSTFERFHIAINRSYLRLINDANALINSTIPDNEDFSKEDAELWEYRLGLITNPLVDLEKRKLSILRKLAFPSNIKSRQHPLYIQKQLRDAGFDVYIHENTVPYTRPEDIVAIPLSNLQHGGGTQHGPSTQHGTANFQVIANSIRPNEIYSIGGDENLYSTFYISGENIGDQAVVPQQREREFRELVLKIKPAQTVAFLIVNFI